MINKKGLEGLKITKMEPRGVEGAVEILRTAYEEMDKKVVVEGRVISQEEIEAQIELLDDILFEVLATIERLQGMAHKFDMKVIGAIILNMLNTPNFMKLVLMHPELLVALEGAKMEIEAVVGNGDRPKKDCPDFDPSC